MEYLLRDWRAGFQHSRGWRRTANIKEKKREKMNMIDTRDEIKTR